MGINNLADIFKENYYKNLDGGILEALGILFKENIRIYAYPIEREFFDRYREQFGRGDNVKLVSLEGSIVNVENLVVAENLRNLYKYVRENGFLECVNQFDRENMRFFARDVFDKIMQREDGWKDQLPSCVSNLIEEKNLWNDAKISEEM